jgi:hypothetical protein
LNKNNTLYNDDIPYPDNPDQDNVVLGPEGIAKPTTPGKNTVIGTETIARSYNIHQAPPPDNTTIQRDVYGNLEDHIAQPRKFLRSVRAYSSLTGDLPHLRSILKPTTKEHETPEPVLSEPYPIEHICASKTARSHRLSDTQLPGQSPTSAPGHVSDSERNRGVRTNLSWNHNLTVRFITGKQIYQREQPVIYQTEHDFLTPKTYETPLLRHE